MCGIGGIVTSDREIQPVLDKMMSSLAHRGPDNQTSFTTENLGLAHTRLSIIDLSESSNHRWYWIYWKSYLPLTFRKGL